MPSIDRILADYQYALHMSGLATKAETWIALGIMSGLGLFVLTFAVIYWWLPGVSLILAVVAGFAAADIILGYPIVKKQQKLEQIEEVFPDALKQMADTLRTGGTYEFALREVASSDYGPLTDEMNLALRKMNEGENLENGLRGIAKNIKSKNVNRVITIIIDSVKAGAGLADVLDDISDDVRQLNRVNRERKSTTLMQVLFILAAGSVIAPAILGLVTGIVQLLIASTSALPLTSYDIALSDYTRAVLFDLLQFYLFIEIVASAAIIAIMHDNRLSKAALYAPILLVIGFTTYYVSLAFAHGIMGLP